MFSKFLSLTVFLGVYSTPQYTMVSTLSKELAFRLLTVVLLYFNMNEGKYINAAEHENARKAAGWGGMLFASFSSLDAALRPKYKKLRIFDELSIVCVYIALWAMFYTMFKKSSILFMVIAGLSTVGIFAYAFCKRENQVKGPTPHKSLEPVLELLKAEALSGDRQVQRFIDCLAIILVVINPEDSNTLAVLEIMKEAHTPPPEAPKTTGEQPPRPQATGGEIP